ncbi:uncharacterized protein LOC143275239 [Babylonia areolata]|uniref:uncharacterized protein LOC143275239 n=1 Tax=Babylonia areolata TaxID=304850 RepID=UPI003FD26623
MSSLGKTRMELFHLIRLKPASSSPSSPSRVQNSPKAIPDVHHHHHHHQQQQQQQQHHRHNNQRQPQTMTGTVHFDVPVTSSSSSSASNPAHHHHYPSSPSSSSSRPALLRPVSMEEADNSVNEIHESLPRKAAVRLYRQISSGFNSRTIRCLLVVSLGLNLIFGVLVGIFVGFWQSSRLELGGGGGGAGAGGAVLNVPTKEQLYACFPCSEDGVPGLRITVRSQNGVCCTSDSVPWLRSVQQTDLFVRPSHYMIVLKLTREYVRSHCPDKSGSDSSQKEQRDRVPAAHLTLDVAESKALLKQLPDDKHYLSWNVQDETGATFISDGLRYANGTLTIPSSGRYHVYTHLTFDTTANKLEQPQLVVDHSIARISRGSPVYLLLDRVNLLARQIKSSDLEGTFEFRKGDVVKVVVSFPSYLYNLPQTNVFGLFKLLS